MIRSARRYESAAGAGPITTASSASRTCRASASASESTATVAIPMRRAVRITRQAISPRLAIRILRNIGGRWTASSQRDVIVLLPRVGELLVAQHVEGATEAAPRRRRLDHIVDK